MQRLKSEWYLMLFSILLAFSLWAFVTSREVAFQRKFFSIPLEVTNLPQGLVCVKRAEKVTVTVSGPREELAKLERGSVEAHVNASRLEPGRHTLRVKVSLPPGLKLLSVSPSRVTVVLERLMRKEMAIRVAFLGAPPEGARVVGMEIRPLKATIEGPTSKVLRAEAAVVLLEVPSGSSAVETRAPVRILDNNHMPIRGIQVFPSTVTVRLSLRPAFASKTLPVHPQVVGSPAGGLEVVSVEATPNFVTVSGSPDALGRLKFIRTRPVDVSRATENFIQRVDLINPPEVSAMSMDSVTVLVRLGRKPSPAPEQIPPPSSQEEAPKPPAEGAQRTQQATGQPAPTQPQR